MNTIKTKSFELAIYAQGDESSDKIILCLPGRLDTKDYAHMRHLVDFFALKGYFSISFDPPGTWESSGDIELYTMTNYLKATNEIIEYFGNKPTAVIGHSRGGSMALLSGVTNPYITHIISIMGVDNYIKDLDDVSYDDWKKRGYKESYRDLPPGSNKKEKLFKLPYSFLEDSQQYDMRDKLRSCEKPKLFIAGVRDELVPFEEVRAAFDNASDPKEIYKLNSDHDYRYHQDLIEEVSSVIDKFLVKHSF